MIYVRPNDPGQPWLDGRGCYACKDDAVLNIEIESASVYLHELRLCGACATALRDAIENGLQGRFNPRPRGKR